MNKQVMKDCGGESIGIGDKFSYDCGETIENGEVIETVGKTATIIWEDGTVPIDVVDFYCKQTDQERLKKL